MTTANKITVIRILMIPIFVTLAIYYGESIQEGHPQDWMRFTAITVFLLAAVSDGLIDPLPLISHRASLEEAPHMYELFESRLATKVVLRP